MTLDQVCDLLALELTPFWRAYIVTALTCGVRPGELLGLRWRDIDFSQGIIRVRMCLKALPGPDGYGKRVLTVAELKTDRSRRTLQMPRDAAVVLRALKAQQTKDRLRLGKPAPDRRQGEQGCRRDGPDFRRGERLMRQIGSPAWLPQPCHKAADQARSRVFVSPCADSGGRPAARTAP